MKSLKLKFYLIFITAIITPILIMGVLFSYIYISQIEKRILTEQNDLLNSLKVNIVEKHISDTETLLYSLAKDKNLPYVFNNPEIRKMILADWELCHKLFPERCWIYYGSINNDILVSPEWTPPDEYDLLKRPWYVNGMESDHVKWTEPYEEYITGDIVISATLGIKDQKDKYTGVLSIDTTTKDFLEIMKKFCSEKKTRLLAVSNDGHVVGLNQIGDELIIDTETFDWQTIINNPKKTIKIKKTNYYYQVSSADKLKMAFVSLIPAKGVNEEVFPVFFLIYLILTLSLISAIAAGFLLSKRIIEAIVKVNYQIGLMAQGNYNIVDTVYGSKEFKTINQNLNFLAKIIKSQMNELSSLNEVLNKELIENKRLVELRTSLLHIFVHNSAPEIMLQLDLCRNLLESDRSNQTYFFLIRATRNLKTLNENVMIYLKLDEGIEKIYNDEIDLGFITKIILDNCEIQTGEKNLKINYNNAPVSVVYGPYFLVKVALENLIDNAIKYSYPNGVITINIEERFEELVWAIEDGGPGFSQEDKKNLYGKFQRLSAKPTGGESSTGLGLYLVKTIADYLNIKLNLINDRNVAGARFELTFSDNRYRANPK